MRWLLAIALAACAHDRVIVIHDRCDSRAMRPAIACEAGQLTLYVNGYRVEATE